MTMRIHSPELQGENLTYMPQHECLEFEDLNAAILLEDCAPLHPIMEAVFPGWPFKIRQSTDHPIFAYIKHHKDRYEFRALYKPDVQRYRHGVDVLCALAAEMAWAVLRADPGLLCLHGAAIDINGLLFVIPNTRRAGKSTLSVVLASRGYRVFTDDFLPIKVTNGAPILGMACGIAPRLRRPLPDDLSDQSRAYASTEATRQSDRYRYVPPTEQRRISFGSTLPIGGIMVLDRIPEAKADVSACLPSEILKALIFQNFSRRLSANGIVTVFEHLARRLPGYRITAPNAEAAADEFEALVTGLPKTQQNYHGVQPTEVAFDPSDPSSTFTAEEANQLMIRAPGVREIALDEEVFLICPEDRSIHHLNHGAQMYWTLLNDPIRPTQMMDILVSAFPDQTKDEMRADLHRTLQKFIASKLVTTAAK